VKPDPVDIVVGYHDRTKHHPGRYARSLGYLDWATQPNPFRRFQGSPLVHLPIPIENSGPAYDQLLEPGRIAPEQLTVGTVSTFFYLSLALSAWKQAGASRWSLRCNPSSGNLHPTEGYAILPAIEGLGEEPAVYHYAPREHGLERRARLSAEAFDGLTRGFSFDQPAASQRPFCFLAALSSIYWREAWKYGERAFRYCHHDLGHALAGLRFAAAALGWRMVVLADLSDEVSARLLGLDRAQDFAGAEPEHPDLLAAVFPANATGRVPLGLDPQAIEAIAESEWTGKANELSPDHVEWDIIDAVHQATSKPGTASAPVDLSAAPSTGSADQPNRSAFAFQVIRTRRSALDFDGRTAMPVARFYEMLSRVMPGALFDGNIRERPARPVPWDCVDWAPRIHLFMFVHLVEGLSPGLYALIRDHRKVDEIKHACDSEFAWSVPPARPSDLPLFLLLATDCRRAAAQLSLGQDIAGTSAFSMGMVAEFEPALHEHGPWYYRRLFWEAGMVGQVLYLDAEAAGLRATGIGAYFDDLVHETLGLKDHRFQSLYHFTVGGAVEDCRILSAPAYPVRSVDQISS
jgi:SagB-type dehydrogenase family enzyme